MELSVFEMVTLVLCFILSGFFSGSEAVLLSIPIDRARQIIDEGGARANAFRFILDSSNEVLTTILIGNNIVNVLASSLTTVIAARVFKEDSIGYAVGITTFLILVFGEIIPKTLARTHAEKFSFVVIIILRFFYILFYPVVKIVSLMISKILGGNSEITERIVRSNDVEYMIQKAEKENTMDLKQIDMLNSILEFPKIKVKDVMISRKEIKSIQLSITYEELISFLLVDSHSRYPVYDKELENVQGLLHVKSLAFITEEEKKSFDLKKYLKMPFFVYEHMKIQAVFDHMNRKKTHLALVKDENSLVVGIVTLEDIIEEVLGEIQDEHDVEEERIDKEYEKMDFVEGVLLDGKISLRDLYNDYEIKIPLNDNYSTLAGFLLDILGNNFPETGQIIFWEGMSFELTKIDDYEIREIKIKDVDGEKHFFRKKNI